MYKDEPPQDPRSEIFLNSLFSSRKRLTEADFIQPKIQDEQVQTLEKHLTEFLEAQDFNVAMSFLIDDISMMGRKCLFFFQDQHMQLLINLIDNPLTADNAVRVLAKFSSLDEIHPFFLIGILQEKLKPVFQYGNNQLVQRAITLIGNSCNSSDEFRDKCFETGLIPIIINSPQANPKDLSWLLRTTLSNHNPNYFNLVAPTMIQIAQSDGNPGLKNVLHILLNAPLSYLPIIEKENFFPLLIQTAGNDIKYQNQVSALNILYNCILSNPNIFNVYNQYNLQLILGKIICPVLPIESPPEEEKIVEKVNDTESEYEMPSPYEIPPDQEYQPARHSLISNIYNNHSERVFFSLKILYQWAKSDPSLLFDCFSGFPFIMLFEVCSSANKDLLYLFLNELLTKANNEFFFSVFSPQIAQVVTDVIGCNNLAVNNAAFNILVSALDRLEDKTDLIQMIEDRCDRREINCLSEDDTIGEIVQIFLSKLEKQDE